MIAKKNYSIFKQGSRTYFYSSLFFPAKIKADVFTLYSFVRTADDFVDQKPAQANAFLAFRKSYTTAMQGKENRDDIITAFVDLARRKKFDPSWTETFLDTMESDLSITKYATLKDTSHYMYGSAEVIGLMMARILNLPQRAWPYAQRLGRSMQYVNFIRDISEDLSLGRNYFPQSEMEKYGLRSLEETEVSHKKLNFSNFISAQLTRYKTWQIEGQKGYEFIPRQYLIPIKTASDLYNWTATQIAKDPMIVYQKKMKPPIIVIAMTLIKNMVTTL